MDRQRICNLVIMITHQITELLVARLPESWFNGAPAVTADGDEILVVGALTDGADVAAFRERTREERMAIADDLERRFDRKVTWGVTSGGTTTIFTSLALPVMTRLRLPERGVLDTLVDGGVARSRSEALAWCVKLVARHQHEWLVELRDALSGVANVRAEGPTLS